MPPGYISHRYSDELHRVLPLVLNLRKLHILGNAESGLRQPREIGGVILASLEVAMMWSWFATIINDVIHLGDAEKVGRCATPWSELIGQKLNSGVGKVSSMSPVAKEAHSVH